MEGKAPHITQKGSAKKSSNKCLNSKINPDQKTNIRNNRLPPLFIYVRESNFYQNNESKRDKWFHLNSTNNRTAFKCHQVLKKSLSSFVKPDPKTNFRNNRPPPLFIYMPEKATLITTYLNAAV